MFNTLVICALLGSSLASAARTEPRVVDCRRNITYIGSLDNGVENFSNIRFGKTTAEEWRFKPPRPFHYAEKAIVNATSEGPACAQVKGGTFFGFPTGVTTTSEDCLNLKIARPTGTTSQSALPVMVWIYGGSDETGTYNSALYDPQGLILNAAQRGRPVLYVAINYRVNIFGFANSEVLLKERSLNNGLRDQRLGLEWIQDNIGFFGGDPDLVTIFGQSDGGTGAGLQLSAFGGKGKAPFKHVILESGAGTADPGVSSNELTRRATTFVAQHAGCSGSDSSVLKCLREKSTEGIVKAVNAWQIKEKNQPQDIFYPAVDGDFIPMAPSELLRTGAFYKNISAIVGWAQNDGTIFTDSKIRTEKDTIAFIRTAYPDLTMSTIKHLLALYPVSEFISGAQRLNISAQYLRSAEILTDLNFACPAVFSAQQIAKHGSDAYAYNFNATYIAALEKEKHLEYLGVIHTSEIPFAFYNVPLLRALNVSQDIGLAARVSGSWSNFAASGTPIGNGTLQEWETTNDGNFAKIPIRIIGGPYDGRDLKSKVVQRCEYVNTARVFAQLQT